MERSSNQVEQFLAGARRATNPDNVAPTYATIGLALALLMVVDKIDEAIVLAHDVAREWRSS